MIEWAAHIFDSEMVWQAGFLLERPPAEKELSPLHDLTARLIREYFPSAAFSRVYFGNEFCQHLIPALESLKKAYAASAEAGLGFSLLSPYATDEGLKKLTTLFEFLSAQPDQSEVIFNDWGVLRRLIAFPRLKPVQGRLLDKMLRDPRITGLYRDAPVPLRSAVQRSNVTAPHYLDWLQAHDIELVELDNVMQGLDLDFHASQVGASVYLPYGFVATGRVCMVASLHQPPRERFRSSIRCSRECQQYLTVFQYTSSPFENKDQRFYLKGNTHFYGHTEQMLRQVLERAAAAGIRRFVYQPQLPMQWS